MPDPSASASRHAVGAAIQTLTARRLGRAFVPLAAVAAAGALELLAVGAPGGLALLLGAGAVAGATLSFGLAVSQRALGRPRRLWMRGAGVASVLPPLFGVWLVGWRGLRAVAIPDAPGGVPGALLSIALGVWVLRSWFGVLEIRRLARVMLPDTEQLGGTP